MDNAEIDNLGRGLLFFGKSFVQKCTKVEGQNDVFLLETSAVLRRKSQIAPKPGQFYLLKSAKSSVQLNRPISVFYSEESIDSMTGLKKILLRFLILQKGKGTSELCSLLPGDEIELIGPLGNSFSLPLGVKQEESDKPEICIIGGGIGVAPVANFASSLQDKSYDFFACFRHGFYGLENIKAASLTITTDDGSEGTRGMLPDVFSAETIKNKSYKVIYACGPEALLAYVKKVSEEADCECFLSVEKHMACGVGACLGCTIQTTDGMLRVCKDGPVFNAKILQFKKNQNPQKRNAPLAPTEKPDVSVQIAGVHFKNPVIAASGTFGFGQNYRGLFDVNLLGGIVAKGCTVEPRNGNSGERIVEVSSGNINSIGLQNPGIANFIKDELPRMLKLSPVAIANLAGSSLESYVEGAKLLDKSDVPLIELNISCPNVKSGGQAWGMSPESASCVVSAVRECTKKPIIVKLSPNAPDIKAVALACIKSGADALSLVNTIQAVAIDIEAEKPVFDNVRAGLCGPAIKPIALRMVYDVVEAINQLPKNSRVPVIGMGGIQTWQDAVEFILAGASAIQVGSATFSNPRAMLEIIEGISHFMKTHGYTSISQFCGKAQVVPPAS